jgi:hypothetical protein
VYVDQGTLLGYAFVESMVDGATAYTPVMFYRNVTDGSYCDAFGSYGSISTDCTRMYSVNDDGSMLAVLSQMQYDARDEDWCTDSIIRGSMNWGSMMVSAFTGERVLPVSMPNFDTYAYSNELHSVSGAFLRLDYCKFDLVLY